MGLGKALCPGALLCLDNTMTGVNTGFAGLALNGLIAASGCSGCSGCSVAVGGLGAGLEAGVGAGLGTGVEVPGVEIRITSSSGNCAEGTAASFVISVSAVAIRVFNLTAIVFVLANDASFVAGLLDGALMV